MAKDTAPPQQATKKNDTAIFPHNCVNEGQDKLHGRGMRVMNLGAKGWKCTVCKGLKGEK